MRPVHAPPATPQRRSPSSPTQWQAISCSALTFLRSLPNLCWAAGKIVALGDVVGAELLHPFDAAIDHFDYFIPGHRRHVHWNVPLDVDLPVRDVVQPAVAPPLEIFGGGRNV